MRAEAVVFLAVVLVTCVCGENPSLNQTKSSTSSGPQPDKFGKKLLLVAVCTSPGHFSERQAIRDTWPNLLPSLRKDFDVLFFIGNLQEGNEVLEKKIQAEADVHADIIRLDSFVESYDNLTRKTLGMIRWAATRDYETMLKVDDDTYVMLDNIYYDVVAFDPERSTQWWGKFWGSDDRPVDRVPTSKYYLSRSEYPAETFPNYPDGPCYLLGSSLLKYIDSHASSLHIYRLEDSAVGIWLNDAVTLPFRQTFGGGYMYLRECPEGQYYYFVNPLTPQELLTVHSKYANHVDVCDKGFGLAVCDDPVKGCLCSPSDHNCWDSQHALLL